MAGSAGLFRSPAGSRSAAASATDRNLRMDAALAADEQAVERAGAAFWSPKCRLAGGGRRDEGNRQLGRPLVDRESHAIGNGSAGVLWRQ
jgi:hypothetical protein